MFDLETREFSVSRDVTFIEDEFPFYENVSTTTGERSVDISEVFRPLVDDIDVVGITKVVDTGVIVEDVTHNNESVTHDVSQTEDSGLQGVTQPETCVTPTEEEPDIEGEELR